MKPGAEHYKPFYLVQRLMPGLPGGRVNPFGYGVLGDYALDYMGSAEFEWGALPDSYNRFDGAASVETGWMEMGAISLPGGKKSTNDGVKVEAIWITADGEPWDRMIEWIGEGCYGKEPSFDFLFESAFLRVVVLAPLEGGRQT